MEGVFELGVVLSLKDLATSKLSEINDKWDKFRKTLGDTHEDVIKMDKALSQMKAGGAILSVGLAAGFLTASFLNARMQTSQLEADIRSLGLTQVDVDGITESAYRLSIRTGLTKEAILTGVYDIKSAISDLDSASLSGFTESVASAALATKGNFEQMSKLFGMTYHQFKKIYSEGMDPILDKDKKFDNIMFGKIIANNIAMASNIFRADGATIEQAMTSLGSTAASMNISLEEQSAVLGTLLNTMVPGTAGTSLRAFLSKSVEGMQKLGLSAFDAKGKLKSVPDMIDEINKKMGGDLTRNSKILNEAFSEEGLKAVQALVPVTGQLKENILQFQNATKNRDFSFITKMEQERLNSLPMLLNRASEGWRVFQDRVGKAIETGPLSSVVGLTVKLLEGLNDLMAANPKIASFIGTFLQIATIAGVALGGMLLLKGAFSAFMIAVNIGLVSNPFGWIVLGVAAAIVAISLLIANWDKIKGWWSGMPDWMRGIIGLILLPLWSFIWLPLLIIKNWDMIKNFLTSIPGDVANAWSFLPDWGKNLIYIFLLGMVSPFAMIGTLLYNGIRIGFNFLEDLAKTSGNKFVKTFAGGIVSGVSFLKESVIDLLGAIGRFLPHSDADEGPLSNLSGSGSAFVETFVDGIRRRKSLLGSMMSDVAGGLSDVWTNVKDTGSALIDTIQNGIAEKATALKETVSGVFENTIGKLLPHSDADEGPLSSLTSSGRSIIRTIVGGMDSEPVNSNPIMQRFNQNLQTKSPIIPKYSDEEENSIPGMGKSSKGITLSIANLIGQVNMSSSSDAKRNLLEIIGDALFAEIEKYEEVSA
ncbi:MAG: phage tail tape measure protein [Leptospiraceae bacterium]|nr:phage tail tape measure protein [Leptospiraceae bacterium]